MTRFIPQPKDHGALGSNVACPISVTTESRDFHELCVNLIKVKA